MSGRQPDRSLGVSTKPVFRVRPPKATDTVAKAWNKIA